MPLLRLESVSKTFRRGSGPTVHAVNGVSLTVERGETVALIGESGSGKSTTARLALRLQEPDSGTVVFDGTDLGAVGREELRRLRARMSMVFQEPFESLDPRQTVGRTVEEPLLIHRPDLSPSERRASALETLEQVALGEPFYDRYPAELSGGQQQRVGIARAIVTRPAFIALDEPTASLDLSVRAQILGLLERLREELGLAYLFVSHDIATVSHVADRVCVMYLGRIVEEGPVAEVLDHPRHPYTQALLSATLSPDPTVRTSAIRLAGQLPSATDLPDGCPLHVRCPIAVDACATTAVELDPVAPGHSVACIEADRALVRPVG
ncbi:ABC transporter ATP-binding protein [Pseudonocardia pini]|uniref:ABC transporter ATP-binding protein n=1 Tax=Pseudonocardia pini TaxID=2758030 RepID=UPI0015F081C6|nr:ABC transporter ATP-binding protein [Pseudonocardia pini]